MLNTIKEQLQKFPILPVSPKPDLETAAAVMLILHGDSSNPLLVLTERAAHMNSHPGEVAFPGGMWDPDDGDLLTTALRETEEEIGLSADRIRPIAMLPSASPKTRNLMVRPFVGIAEGALDFTPQPSEIASIFNLPIAPLTDNQQYQYFEVGEGDDVVSLPFFAYQDYKIWGFTLKVLVDMLNATLGVQIKLHYPDGAQLEKLRKRGK